MRFFAASVTLVAITSHIASAIPVTSPADAALHTMESKFSETSRRALDEPQTSSRSTLLFTLSGLVARLVPLTGTLGAALLSAEGGAKSIIGGKANGNGTSALAQDIVTILAGAGNTLTVIVQIVDDLAADLGGKV